MEDALQLCKPSGRYRAAKHPPSPVQSELHSDFNTDSEPDHKSDADFSAVMDRARSGPDVLSLEEDTHALHTIDALVPDPGVVSMSELGMLVYSRLRSCEKTRMNPYSNCY